MLVRLILTGMNDRSIDFDSEHLSEYVWRGMVMFSMGKHGSPGFGAKIFGQGEGVRPKLCVIRLCRSKSRSPPEEINGRTFTSKPSLFCLVHPAHVLFNSTPQRLARDHGAVAKEVL
jgi:hypothetical protein